MNETEALFYLKQGQVLFRKVGFNVEITLDTNCLIDIEEKRKDYEELIKLIELFNKGNVKIRVPAISASDKMSTDKERMKSFGDFQKYLKQIGLENAQLLNPFLIWNITFWGHSMWASKEMVALECEIHNILFPDIPYQCEWPSEGEHNKLFKKWRNSRCDSLVLWSHIYYKGEVFVTNDENFFKKTKINKLIQLGANKIVRPSEVSSILT